MGQGGIDLPDPADVNATAGVGGADDLLAQLAGDEIDRLLADNESTPETPAADDRSADPISESTEASDLTESSTGQATEVREPAEDPLPSNEAIDKGSVPEEPPARQTAQAEGEPAADANPTPDTQATPIIAPQPTPLAEAAPAVPSLRGAAPPKSGKLNQEIDALFAELDPEQAKAQASLRANASADDEAARLAAAIGDWAAAPVPQSQPEPSAAPDDLAEAIAQPAEQAIDAPKAGDPEAVALDAGDSSAAIAAELDLDAASAAVVAESAAPLPEGLDATDVAELQAQVDADLAAGDAALLPESKATPATQTTAAKETAAATDSHVAKAERAPSLGSKVLIGTLEAMNAPLAGSPDWVRDMLGKVALLTLFNAIAVIIYIAFFRK